MVNLGAYATEIIRAGIDNIHPARSRPATALAMTKLQMFRYVVLMPALAQGLAGADQPVRAAHARPPRSAR